MSEAETYDTRVQAIRAYNRPLLEDFGTWLDHKGFSEQTVMNHLGNIYLFASYLVYDEPLKKLDEATESDVYWFLADWFPRKALWASVRSVQVYCASFKKFFQWMGETRRVSSKTVAEVISTLKEERNVFLAQVAKSSCGHTLSVMGCRLCWEQQPGEPASSDGNQCVSQASPHHCITRSAEDDALLHFSCAK